MRAWSEKTINKTNKKKTKHISNGFIWVNIFVWIEIRTYRDFTHNKKWLQTWRIFIILINKHVLVRSHWWSICVLQMYLCFLNFWIEGARWWFWWTARCSTEVLCLTVYLVCISTGGTYVNHKALNGWLWWEKRTLYKEITNSEMLTLAARLHQFQCRT
jgi:hypothetical protein